MKMGIFGLMIRRIILLTYDGFLYLTVEQANRFIQGPHKPRFPINEIWARILKTPSLGTFLYNWLKERFSYWRTFNFAGSIGMLPDKLLEEKYATIRLSNQAREVGMKPASLLFEILRYSSPM